MAKTPYNTTGYGGAQVLPDSSYSPLDRMLQMGLSPGGGGTKAEREQYEKDRREGFDPEKIEAWEDLTSHREISKAMDDLRSVWQQSFASGYNIANPKNQYDWELQKVFNEKFSQVQRASDLYKSQGKRYAGWKEAMDKDKDRLDIETTQANIDEWKKKDPFERAEGFDQVLAWKDEPVDITDYTLTNLGRMLNIEKETIEKGIDPETGKLKLEILEGYPIEERREKLRNIWKFSPEDFQMAVVEKSKEDITFTADPSVPDYMNKVGEWYVKEHEGIKAGEKRTLTYVSPTKDKQAGFEFSGLPEKDATTGLYSQRDDTVQMHNSVTNRKDDDHTSPLAVYLQGENMYGVDTPAKALAVSITDDYINTQTGKPETAAGTYAVLPTKVVWLNVLEDDVEISKGLLSFYARDVYKAGQVLNDEQVAQINDYNQNNLGMPPKKYKKVPFVIGRMKYGQVETTGAQGQPKIESFNRSFRVPLEVIQNDIRAHKGKEWDEYQRRIDEITMQLNSSWGYQAPTKAPLHM